MKLKKLRTEESKLEKEHKKLIKKARKIRQRIVAKDEKGRKLEGEQRAKGLELHKGKWMTKEQITKDIIEENLKRAEKGEPLTMPLSQLNGLFKREYAKRTKTNISLNGFLNLL